MADKYVRHANFVGDKILEKYFSGLLNRGVHDLPMILTSLEGGPVGPGYGPGRSFNLIQVIAKNFNSNGIPSCIDIGGILGLIIIVLETWKT